MNITGHTRLAEITALFPVAERVFREHGLDPELLADTALADALEGTNVSVPRLIAEIRRAARRERGPERPPAEAEAVTPEEITDLIVGSVHPALDRALGAIGTRLSEVLLDEGDDHPDLYEVGREFDRLRRLVRGHMAETRGILFPRLLSGASEAETSVSVRQLESAHGAIEIAVSALQDVSLGFQTPEDATDEWLALYADLSDLEKDVKRLIHMEDARLVPAVRKRRATD